MSGKQDEARWSCRGAAAARKLCHSASAANDEDQTATPFPLQPPLLEKHKKPKRLKPDKWKAAFDKDGRLVGFDRVLKSILSGGVDHSIRGEVWEFLLGCYSLDSTSDYRQKLRDARRGRYKELIAVCQRIHASVGSGSLACTVGSKVMDVRIMSKESAKKEAKLWVESVDSVASTENLHEGSIEQVTENTRVLEQEHRDKAKEMQSVQEGSNVPIQDMGSNEEKVAEWLWTLHRIVVDVVRTDRHLKFYDDAKNMAHMSDILAIYAWIDPATGYCQGMSDLLSPFIVIFKDDADAFWCFESMLRRVRQNFQMEGPVGVMTQLEALKKILELTDMNMYKHLLLIGAGNFIFAFRMLLVLFRRELSFGEALYMWEMMWAADFDKNRPWVLECKCPELLSISQPLKSLQEPCGWEDNNSDQQKMQKSSLQSLQGPFLPSQDNPVEHSSRSPFCGLKRASFWPKNLPKVRTVRSLPGRTGDNELSVFVVAAILVLNRAKFIKEVQSLDDAIKMFNDIRLKIEVKRCVQVAVKLRKKYRKRLLDRDL